jgi:hypothetical protein
MHFEKLHRKQIACEVESDSRKPDQNRTDNDENAGRILSHQAQPLDVHNIADVSLFLGRNFTL